MSPILVSFKTVDSALHLACDEVLLEQAEAGERGETLRFSEVEAPVVVLGIGGEWEKEIYRDRCREEGVPVLRRSSGGGTVVLARGSLNYGAILDTERDQALKGIRESYAWIFSRIAAALSRRGIDAAHSGLSDLSWKNKKVGGSAQRRKRRYILHHGTLLYDFDLSLLPRFLKEPPVAPEYRAGRDHEEFVANVALTGEDLRGAIMEAFEVTGNPVDVMPGTVHAAEALAEEKYRQDEWTFRL